MKETAIDLSDLLHGVSMEVDVDDFVTAMLIIDCHCILGEGVIYDDIAHAVMWTDIDGKKFHKLQLNYEHEPREKKVIHTVYDLPKMMGSFGLLTTTDSSAKLPLLCAWEDGFQLYDVAENKELSEISSGEPVNPKGLPTRLNDGRVDPTGKRFVCGGFYGNISDVTMKVFKLEQDPTSKKLKHEPIVSDIQVTNSICWSPDGDTMYLANSPSKQIHAYKYSSEDGTISEKKLLHTKPENEEGVPDGSCVDADGYIWNAVWRGGHAPTCVQRIDPATGHVVFTVHLPDATSRVTCCCFGGENLDILFITSASEGVDTKHKEPHAGGLYAAKVPFKGRKESRLNFSI